MPLHYLVLSLFGFKLCFQGDFEMVISDYARAKSLFSETDIKTFKKGKNFDSNYHTYCANLLHLGKMRGNPYKYIYVFTVDAVYQFCQFSRRLLQFLHFVWLRY